MVKKKSKKKSSKSKKKKEDENKDEPKEKFHSSFRKQFFEQLLVAITAALAFLIALSWRTPIQNTVDIIIIKLGITGEGVYIEYLAAIIITIIGVLILMLLSKYKKE